MDPTPMTDALMDTAPPVAADEAPLLEARDVSKYFGAVVALEGVSLTVKAGRVTCLLGDNGAGKSTLIKILTGAQAADDGTLEIGGQIVTHHDPQRSRQRGIAAIYQQPALFPDLTVAENIALGLESGGAWRRIRWTQRRWLVH